MEKTVTTSALPRVAEVKLSYRNKVKPSERQHVTCSADSYLVLKESWDKSKIELVEQFKVLLLNRANRVLGVYELSTGGVAGTVADPKLIFVAALKACASGVILSPTTTLRETSNSARQTCSSPRKSSKEASCWTSPSSITSSSPTRAIIH